jgi:osmotically-inducible protein OsmY
MSKWKDERITQDVLDELVWDPAVRVVDLNVSTDNGRVLLTGKTDTYGMKLEAGKVASRVFGVKSVENEIVVEPPASSIRSDTAIKKDVKTALVLDYKVPDDRIYVSVTLDGDVDWFYQKEAAGNDAAMIPGVICVYNEIIVDQPQTSAAAISSGIARAFARNAELSDDNITVSIDGGNVTLSGRVKTWSEHDIAEAVAWKSPGVTLVTNNIEVLFP